MNIIREYPNTENTFLRFQVGYMSKRPIKIPVYDGNRIASYRAGEPDDVFNLIGFGETMEEAEKMAGSR